MKQRSKLRRAFGQNQYGMLEMPQKLSGTKISRLVYGEILGCSYCFPHGWEVSNSRWKKDLRCWKRYRKHQWRGK